MLHQAAAREAQDSPATMKTELPMTMLGIEASKGGRGDKEPIYKVKASFCRGYALCLLISIMLAGALFFYEDPDDAKRVLMPGLMRARRAAQHLGHFRVCLLYTSDAADE